MGEAKRKSSIAEVAALMEAKGYTAPDKHDLLMATLGNRARIAEVGAQDGFVKVKFGETTIEKAKLMLSTMSDKHNIGFVSIALGRDFDEAYPVDSGDHHSGVC
jgi:hypothetical protein